MSRKPWIQLGIAETDDLWHWVLWAGNGKPLAQSSEGYKRQNDCNRAATQVIDAMAEEPEIVVKRSRANRGKNAQSPAKSPDSD